MSATNKARKGSVLEQDIRWEISKYQQLHFRAKIPLGNLAL